MATLTATISAGQSLSNGVNVIGTLIGICVPQDFKSSLLTFQISPDNGVTWYDLMDDLPHNEIAFNVTAGCFSSISSNSPLDNKTFIRLRSGTRNNPVIQPVDAAFILISV